MSDEPTFVHKSDGWQWDKDGWCSGIKHDNPALEICRHRGWKDVEIARLAAENKRLREAVRDARDTALELGPGADVDANPNDESPEDATAHQAGLLWQRMSKALEADS